MDNIAGNRLQLKGDDALDRISVIREGEQCGRRFLLMGKGFTPCLMLNRRSAQRADGLWTQGEAGHSFEF